MKKKILISYVSYSNTSKSVAYNIYDKLDKKKYIVSLIDLSEYGSKINMFSNFLFKNNLELLSGLFLKLVNNKLMAISYKKQSIKCFDSEELNLFVGDKITLEDTNNVLYKFNITKLILRA